VCSEANSLSRGAAASEVVCSAVRLLDADPWALGASVVGGWRLPRFGWVRTGSVGTGSASLRFFTGPSASPDETRLSSTHSLHNQLSGLAALPDSQHGAHNLLNMLFLPLFEAMELVRICAIMSSSRLAGSQCRMREASQQLSLGHFQYWPVPASGLGS
jgi:hypothetical protein